MSGIASRGTTSDFRVHSLVTGPIRNVMVSRMTRLIRSIIGRSKALSKYSKRLHVSKWVVRHRQACSFADVCIFGVFIRT